MHACEAAFCISEATRMPRQKTVQIRSHQAVCGSYPRAATTRCFPASSSVQESRLLLPPIWPGRLPVRRRYWPPPRRSTTSTQLITVFVARKSLIWVNFLSASNPIAGTVIRLRSRSSYRSSISAGERAPASTVSAVCSAYIVAFVLDISPKQARFQARWDLALSSAIASSR